MFNLIICPACGIYIQGMLIIAPLPKPLPPPPPEEARIELIVDKTIV